MPTKTLYVKDQQLWEKASRLAGHQGLSRIIMQLLAKWVAEKEMREAAKDGKEYSEVKLWVGGDEHRRWHPEDAIEGDYNVAFTGRLVCSTEGIGWHAAEGGYSTSPVVEVYEMTDGRLAVYRSDDDVRRGATFIISSDFQDLNNNPLALDTLWLETDSEPEPEELKVLAFTDRTAKEETIVALTNMWGKQTVMEQLPKMGAPGADKITAGDIEVFYEDARKEGYGLRFLKDISNALGVEMIVRIDRRTHDATE